MLNWDLNIYSLFVGCLFTYCKNWDLSLALQQYNFLSVLLQVFNQGSKHVAFKLLQYNFVSSLYLWINSVKLQTVVFYLYI